MYYTYNHLKLSEKQVFSSIFRKKMVVKRFTYKKRSEIARLITSNIC